MLEPEVTKILSKDFPRTKTVRAIADKFLHYVRGSRRIARGLYRTEDEQEAFIKKGLATKLPGCR
jgi:hypothetical protein